MFQEISLNHCWLLPICQKFPDKVQLCRLSNLICVCLRVSVLYFIICSWNSSVKKNNTKNISIPQLYLFVPGDPAWTGAIRLLPDGLHVGIGPYHGGGSVSPTGQTVQTGCGCGRVETVEEVDGRVAPPFQKLFLDNWKLNLY